MNISTRQLSRNSKATTSPGNDFVCAFTTVILLSITCWANSPPIEQASPNPQATVFSNSLSWINR